MGTNDPDDDADADEGVESDVGEPEQTSEEGEGHGQPREGSGQGQPSQGTGGGQPSQGTGQGQPGGGQGQPGSSQGQPGANQGQSSAGQPQGGQPRGGGQPANQGSGHPQQGGGQPTQTGGQPQHGGHGGQPQQGGQPPQGGQYQQMGQPQGQPQGQAAGYQQQGSDLDPTTAGALSYVFGWVSGLFFLVASDDDFVRFHAAQSVATFGVLNLVYIVLWIIRAATWNPFAQGLWRLMGTINTLFLVANIGLALFLMYHAAEGRRYRVPVGADLADSILSRNTQPASQQPPQQPPQQPGQR